MFFTEKENLKDIINTILPSPKNIKKYSTGWTNIVMEATDKNNECFVFRFPRNDFFSKQIEKDVIANNFLKSKINAFKTIDLNIKYDSKARPFSIHTKIEGESLTNRLNYLKFDEKCKIIKEIAEFLSKVHSIKVNLNEIPDKLNVRLSHFLNELAKVDDNYYDYSLQQEMEKEENESNLVFVHGDLNIGNILLNENNEIVAFLDFAFFGLSDIYSDLSRISCRVDDEFMDLLIKFYEEINNIVIDKDKLEKRNKMWKYVEEQYIIYMKKYFPEIELPKE